MAKLWLPTLRHSSELFRRVCRIHAEMCALASRRVITWHLEECSWAEGYSCAMLGALKRWHEARGVRVRIEWLHRNVRQALQRNGFLPEEFAYDTMQDSYGTTIPYVRFDLADHHGFDGYVRQYFAAGSQMLPEMTTSLVASFRESLYELGQNARLHSESELGIHACGQLYPRQDLVRFTVCDLGVGIRQRLALSGIGQMSAAEAIEWAVQPDTTTRPRITGGLGFGLLRDLVAANDGELWILSDRALWSQHGQQTECEELECAFPGTAVTLALRKDPGVIYSSREEPTNRR